MNDCVKLPSFSEATKEATMQEPTPTPVFDFNATLNAVLAQAVQIHTTPLLARIAVLEERLENITTASDEQIRMIAIEEVEEQMAAHHNSYDHDEYDRLVGDLDDKINDAINDLDFEDKINDALRSATISISV